MLARSLSGPVRCPDPYSRFPYSVTAKLASMGALRTYRDSIPRRTMDGFPCRTPAGPPPHAAHGELIFEACVRLVIIECAEHAWYARGLGPVNGAADATQAITDFFGPSTGSGGGCLTGAADNAFATEDARARSTCGRSPWRQSQARALAGLEQAQDGGHARRLRTTLHLLAHLA